MIILISLLFLGINANDFQLDNELFSAKFNYNKIILDDNVITYGYLQEDNTNKDIKIEFDNINSDNDYSLNQVRTTYKSRYAYFDVINKMFTNDTFYKNDFKENVKYFKNTLYVTINIDGWVFNNKTNELILDLNFNKPFIYKNKTHIDFDKYYINIPNYCNVDDHNMKIYFSKYNNRLFIYFPSHQYKVSYTFSISTIKKTTNKNYLYYYITIIITSIISIKYYIKYRRDSLYKYKYY